MENRVEFRLADAKDADISAATIIVVYLETGGIMRIAERLRSELRTGVRIVSRSAQIYGWNPDRTEVHKLANGARTELYRWTVKKSVMEMPAEDDSMPDLRQTHKTKR
jgi:hypothetical protein